MQKLYRVEWEEITPGGEGRAGKWNDVAQTPKVPPVAVNNCKGSAIGAETWSYPMG